MAHCDMSKSCFFSGWLASGMPHTTAYLKDTYCTGNFNKCAIHRLSESLGKDNVPKYFYLSDMLDAQALHRLRISGALAVNQCSKGWKEVNYRIARADSKGPEGMKAA